MNRRTFLSLIGGTAAYPFAARAQQPALPVVGFLSSASAAGFAPRVAAFRQGLSEAGYVEGRNVAIEYRFADGHYDQLPALAAELVRRNVSVLAANGVAAVVAKAATTAIPIVFLIAGDPVEQGLVASLNRPGGNITGVTNLNVEVGPKRLELLHELVPTVTVMALLLNPGSANVEPLSKAVQAAARTLGVELHILYAGSEREIDDAFAKLAQLRAGALVVGTDAFFNDRSEQLAGLAVRHALPTIFQYRAFVAAGGVMSYGGSFVDDYRRGGIYAGRILKGDKPADLPVQQSAKAELIINLKAAKALGLTFPLSLLGRADEVIE
jgi:putative tryptophan/tyrosine transport system substrate-binding protein